MRRITFASLLLLLALSLSAKTGFSGTYTVNGTNPGVGPYKGTLTITPRGEVYDVYWAIGNQQYGGVGIVTNDVLSVGYTGGDRSWLGVIAYKQNASGNLEGRWAVAGRQGKPGTETAVRK
jgi:hypothetical protein